MHDLTKLVSTFVDAVAIVMALILVVSILHRNDKRGHTHKFLLGAVFSLAIVFSMSDPIDLGRGGMFDMRGLLIGTGIALLGPVVGLMAAGTALIYRLGIGGPGVLSGIALIVGAFTGGWVWRWTIEPTSLTLWKKSMLLGLFISLQSIGIFFAPVELWNVILTELIPYIVVSNVIGAIIISHLLSGELSFLSAAQALRIEATTDHLTGLLNRRGLETAYPEICAKAVHQRGQALLYFDVDRFKRINDTFGHGVGDEVLKKVVSSIEANLRTQDTFARLGGDEFAIILSDINAKEANDIAERCRAVVSDAGFTLSDQILALSISVGVVWNRDPVGIEPALQAADKALYQAKSDGRNSVVFLSSINEDPVPTVPLAQETAA